MTMTVSGSSERSNCKKELSRSQLPLPWQARAARGDQRWELVGAAGDRVPGRHHQLQQGGELLAVLGVRLRGLLERKRLLPCPLRTGKNHSLTFLSLTLQMAKWIPTSQVTAPVKKRCGATMNHSFSEPDLARLVQAGGGARGSPRSARHLGNQRDSPRKRKGGILPWARWSLIIWEVCVFIFVLALADWSSVLKADIWDRSFLQEGARCRSSWKTTPEILDDNT